MKTTFLFLAIISLFTVSHAQVHSSSEADQRFNRIMEESLQKLDTASLPSTYQILAHQFSRIGEADQKHWEPYYYAAFCYAYMAINESDKTKIDPLTIKADEYLQKAMQLQKDHSEILTLQAMILNTKILVDPINRFQTNSIQSAQYLQQAKQQNPNNPRPYLVEARTKLFTPAALGGGAEAARPILEKAQLLYQNFTPTNRLAPNWGYSQVEKLLKRIQLSQ
jgi:hypothetical protein